MANPIETMRKLEGLDRAQIARDEAVEEARKELERAERTAGGTFRAREKAYNTALTDGFIIKQVLRPDEIRFVSDTVSRPVGGIFGDTEYDPVSTSLSERHAASLVGKFASNAYARLYWGGDYGGHRGDVHVSFNIAFSDGDEAASVLPESIWDLWEHEELEKGDPITVAYGGALKAIEWRLPTEEEVAAFGQPVAQAS